MTHFLQATLGKKEDEALFVMGIAQLEKSTGNSGIDTRLIADILEKAHVVMRKLGLDISDTTGHELYLTLNSSVQRKDFEELFTDTDYVLLRLDDEIISFNLIDIIENMHHQLPYLKQSISHGQRSLRGELVGRYVDHVRTNEATTLETAFSIGLLPKDKK